MTRTEALPLLLSEVETVCGVFGGDKSVDALRAAFSAYLDALPDPAERGERRRAGFDVGAGEVREGDTAIFEGRECKVLTVHPDGDVQIEIPTYKTVKWRCVTPSPPARTGEGSDGERP